MNNIQIQHHPSIPELHNKLAGELNLPDDQNEAHNKIADLLSDVAIKTLSKKKGAERYQLTFSVRLAQENVGEETTPGKLEWMQITTTKQDLESSIRSMQALRGLVRHMTQETFEAQFAQGEQVKLRVFELGSWLQKGGTRQYGIQKKDDDCDQWRTFTRTTWLGLTPKLQAIDSGPVPPSETFVALNLAAIADDEAAQPFPPHTTRWERLRYNLSTTEITNFMLKIVPSIPMVGQKISTKYETQENRIKKLKAVHWQHLKAQDKGEWLRGKHAEYRTTAEGQEEELTSIQRRAYFQETMEDEEDL